MGYDMYMVEGPTPAEQARIDQTSTAFRAACRARDALNGNRETEKYQAAQTAVEEAAAAMEDAEVNYFRLNIWGMGRAREVMAQVGMVKDGWRGWPDVPYQGDNPVMDEATFEAMREYAEDQDLAGAAEWPAEQTKAYLDYKAEIEATLRRHDGDTPGIGINKLGSNDGWVVTPGECATAAKIWRDLTPEEQDAALDAALDEGDTHAEVRAWFEAWVVWLERAAKRGGFQVY